MKRVNIGGPDGRQGTRLDVHDLHMIGTYAVDDFRRHVADLIRNAGDGPCVVSGFTVERISDTQARVYRGAGIFGAREPGLGDVFGQLISEGAASRLVSLADLPHGTVEVYVWFQYVLGDMQNRAYASADRIERIRNQATRDVPEWFAQATVGGPPSDPQVNGIAYKVAEITWDGTLSADAIHDTRALLFEGQGTGGANPAAAFVIPDFDRGTARATVGVKSLSQWVMAVAKRLEEVSGLAWYAQPLNGENLRSASADVLVSADAAQANAVHLVLSADTATRVTELTLRTIQPGLGGDHRDTLRFVPTQAGARATVELDTTSSPIIAGAGNVQRHIGGAANLRRTTGNNPVMRTANFFGTFEGLHFSASLGNACLVDLNGVTDGATFIGCTFDATALTQSAVRIRAAGHYRFIQCTFHANAGQTCLSIEAAARVTVEDCNFNGGDEGIEASVAPAILEVTGSKFSTTRGINLDAAGGLVTFTANVFTGTTAWRHRVSGPSGEDRVFERAASEPRTSYTGSEVVAGALRVGAEWAQSITNDVSGESGTSRFPVYFGRRPDGDSAILGAEINDADGVVRSFDFMRLREGDSALFADVRARRLYLAGDSIVDPALGFTGNRSSNGLRLARASGSSTELRVLDAAGTAAVDSVIGAKRLRLGEHLYGSPMLPRVVGTIEWRKAWEGSGKQDRRTNGGIGFFESQFVATTPGVTLNVYALDAAGVLWEDGEILNQHFAVGVALGTTNYVVKAHLTTSLDPADLGGAATPKSLEVITCKKTNFGFSLIPKLGSEGWPAGANENSPADVNATYILRFEVMLLD